MPPQDAARHRPFVCTVPSPPPVHSAEEVTLEADFQAVAPLAGITDSHPHQAPSPQQVMLACRLGKQAHGVLRPISSGHI
jgi:hypothetical protein